MHVNAKTLLHIIKSKSKSNGNCNSKNEKNNRSLSERTNNSVYNDNNGSQLRPGSGSITHKQDCIPKKI